MTWYRIQKKTKRNIQNHATRLRTRRADISNRGNFKGTNGNKYLYLNSGMINESTGRTDIKHYLHSNARQVERSLVQSMN